MYLLFHKVINRHNLHFHLLYLYFFNSDRNSSKDLSTLGTVKIIPGIVLPLTASRVAGIINGGVSRVSGNFSVLISLTILSVSS